MSVPFYYTLTGVHRHRRTDCIREGNKVNKATQDDITRLKNIIFSVQDKNVDIYEFGTFSGGSLRNIVACLKQKNASINNINGFDSLVGLPKELKDPKNQSVWCEHAYSVKDCIADGVDMTVEQYKNYVKLPKVDNYNQFNMYKGFYEHVLVDELVQKEGLKPAIFINVDCDIYTSTLECLDFMFRNKLYINGKTVIRYDDWGMLYEHGSCYEDEFNAGEARAHKELCDKYGIECERLATFTTENNCFGRQGLEETYFLIK